MKLIVKLPNNVLLFHDYRFEIISRFYIISSNIRKVWHILEECELFTVTVLMLATL